MNVERKVSRHRRTRQSSKQKTFRQHWRRFYRWIKNNPLKTAAFFASAFIIYITVMFYLYNIDLLNTSDDVVNPKYPFKGLLIPKVSKDSGRLTVRFGSMLSAFSIEQLKKGVAISPLFLTNCESLRKGNDPTKFFIFLEDDRLFVSTGFSDLESEEILGNVNRHHLKLFSEEHASFHADNNFLEILDARDNVIFSMQASNAGIITIQGYFISPQCVYIAAGNFLYAHPKSGTFHIQQALPEIKQIRKIYNSGQ